MYGDLVETTQNYQSNNSQKRMYLILESLSFHKLYCGPCIIHEEFKLNFSKMILLSFEDEIPYLRFSGLRFRFLYKCFIPQWSFHINITDLSFKAVFSHPSPIGTWKFYLCFEMKKLTSSSTQTSQDTSFCQCETPHTKSELDM